MHNVFAQSPSNYGSSKHQIRLSEPTWSLHGDTPDWIRHPPTKGARWASSNTVGHALRDMIRAICVEDASTRAEDMTLQMRYLRRVRGLWGHCWRGNGRRRLAYIIRAIGCSSRPSLRFMSLNIIHRRIFLHCKPRILLTLLYFG